MPEALRDGYRMLWQPIVTLGSESVIGYEALGRIPGVANMGRYLHSLPPTEAVSLDQALVGAALAESAHWPHRIRTFVNLTAHTVRALADGACGVHVPAERASRIVWELPEGPDWDARDAVAVLRNLPPGTEVAMDDFGAGRGDLVRWAAIRPQWVKLDRGLVSGCAIADGQRQLIRGVVAMAAGMGARMVAEGIENRQDALYLHALGVECGQGFLFGRPEPKGHSGNLHQGRGDRRFGS